MAPFMTNRGAKLIFDYVFRGVSLPTNFYAALCTTDTTPTVDTNTLGQLTQVAAGNGYTTGGIALSKNTTDFPTNTEDDTNNYATMTIKDLTWTASGGVLPASGNLPAYLVITTDEATVANRQILFVFDAVMTTAVASGQPWTATNSRMRLNYVSGAAFFTNRGLKLLFDWVFRGVTMPTTFYVALPTAAATVTTNTMSDLTETAAANGYTAGGVALARNTTDFPTNTQNDSSDRAELTSKAFSWTASGGDFPSSGSVNHVVLTTDEGTVGNRQVAFYSPTSAAGAVSVGQTLTINSLQLRLRAA